MAGGRLNKRIRLMKNLIKWLENNTGGIVDTGQQDIRCGSYELSLILEKLNMYSDPMSVKVKKKNYTALSRHFEVVNYDRLNLNVQFIKKINNTPFYYSLINSADLDIHVVDFYCWNLPPMSIRLFYCHCPKNVPAINTFPALDNKDLFELFEQIPLGKEGWAAFVYVVSVKPIERDFGHIASVLDILTSNTDECNKNHICRFFGTAESSGKIELDVLWSSQKYINPDLSIAPSIEKEQGKLYLLHYIYDYFGWKLEKKISENTRNIQMQENELIEITQLYNAFLENDDDNEMVQQMLNQWWTFYGLPLMERKLNQIIKTEPESLTVIALLALQYQLPWAQVYVDRLITGGLNAFCLLILWLSKRIILRYRNGSMFIYPGSTWDNNVKEIRRLNDTWRVKCTRYGKKEFLTILENKKCFYKVDKKIRIILNPAERIIAGRGIIPNTLSDTKESAQIALTVGGSCLYQPILFRKGELTFSGLRLRWILKKKRFQITLKPTLRSQSIILNDTQLDLNKSAKNRFYIDVPFRESKVSFTMLDEGGSLLHRRRVTGHRSVVLSGWALNGHGVFCDSVNFIKGKHQHTIQTGNSGQFLRMIDIPAAATQVDLVCKKMSPIKNKLLFCLDAEWEKVLFYKSALLLYPLQIGIKETLRPYLPAIRSYFLDTFCFIPVFVMDTVCHLYLTDTNKGSQDNKTIVIGRYAEKTDAILGAIFENIFVFG